MLAGNSTCDLLSYYCIVYHKLVLIQRNMSLQDELQNTQSAITCSQLTIETLEQVLTYVQSSQKKTHQNDVNDIGLVSLLLTLNIFHTLF